MKTELLHRLGVMSADSCAAGIAGISAVITISWLYFFEKKFAWLIGPALSFVISYSLYWTPVWLGEDASDFRGWAIILIGFWTFWGTVSSLAVFIFYLIRLSKKRKPLDFSK